MILRAAEPKDASAIAALWNAVIRNTALTFTSDEKAPETLAALIAERAGAFWVAEDHDVQGFVTFGPFRAGPGYAATVEHTIILSDEAQGKGLGRALMQTAMDAAATRGHHIMVAGISSANPGGVAFHTALGFAQTAYMPRVGRKAGQWYDLILMQKTLGAP
ncbi:MAG: N-acetyltransferase family protein [Sulfitobacter sp.]